MPRIPGDRRERPEALNVKQIKDMVKRPLNNPYVGAPMNRPDLQDFFAGKEFSIMLDGIQEIKYKVLDANTLSWYKVGFGVGWEDEYYECYESSSRGLYFLFHLLKNDNSAGKIRIFAIDTHNSLVTLISGSIGLLDYTPRDTDAAPYFGYIDWHDGAEPPKERHDYTLELIQKNILWRVNNYNQIHYYSNRHHFSCQEFGKMNGFVSSERARHIMLRENVYLFYWREMQGSGILSCDIMDLNAFYGVGVRFGVTDYVFVCSGFTREEGRFVTDEELVEFECVFDETQDQRVALKKVFGVDLDDYIVPTMEF